MNSSSDEGMDRRRDELSDSEVGNEETTDGREVTPQGRRESDEGI